MGQFCEFCDRLSDSDLEQVDLEHFMKNDKKGGRIFLAAAGIVAVLARRAADAASLEAGRKASLAALAQKKVLEALKYLSDAHKNENSREIQADEGASMPVTELGSNNYSSHELGAGSRGSRGRGRSRGRGAGESSRGRGVGRGRGRGRGRGKVHGLGAAGSSRGHGASDSDSDTDTDSDYNPGSASESNSETGTDANIGADSVSDYVGSNGKSKRKHPY